MSVIFVITVPSTWHILSLPAATMLAAEGLNLFDRTFIPFTFTFTFKVGSQIKLQSRLTAVSTIVDTVPRVSTGHKLPLIMYKHWEISSTGNYSVPLKYY